MLIRYRYVETMVVLACIDETVLKAFDPMTILAALCLISADVEKNDPSDILSILTVSYLTQNYVGPYMTVPFEQWAQTGSHHGALTPESHKRADNSINRG